MQYITWLNLFLFRQKLAELAEQQIYGTHQQLKKVTVQTLRLPNATVPFSTVVNHVGVFLTVG